MIANWTSKAIRAWDRLSVGSRTGLRLTARRPNCVILMFHSVGGLEEAPYVARWSAPTVSGRELKEVLSFFARRGFKSATVSQFARQRREGSVHPRTLVLTFDDGFADNYRVAAPILRELGMTGTFYPVSGWAGKAAPAWLHRAAYYVDCWESEFAEATGQAAGERWAAFFSRFRSTGCAGRDGLLVFRQALHPWEQRAVLARLADRHGYPPAVRLYMNWQELAELQAAGMEIGAHTVTHRSLWTLPGTLAAREIAESKDIVERKLGGTVTTFAYPYGHYLPEHLPMIRDSGFHAAVTCRGHNNQIATSLFELGRHGMNRNTLGRYPLGRLVLDRVEDPVARVNRRLGRHLGRTQADPENGLVTFAADGIRYDPKAGMLLPQQTS